MQSPKDLPKSIDEYISNAPEESKEKLKEIRKIIKEVMPEMTETITYQMPTFQLNGKSVVYFAGYKKHIGFYPFPSGIKAFQEETKNYVTSTGTIQFSLDKPLPVDLIKRIVEYRVQERLASGNKSGY